MVMRFKLNVCDWHQLQASTIDDAFQFSYDQINNICSSHVPQSEVPCMRSTLPWLDDACKSAITVKHVSEGTDAYGHARKACRIFLQTARAKYTAELKTQLLKLPRGSNKWWVSSE